MRQKEFSERRDKLLEDYTLRAHPAYQRYLKASRSKESRIYQGAYGVLQIELKPQLDKLFAQIADLKSQVV